MPAEVLRERHSLGKPKPTLLPQAFKQQRARRGGQNQTPTNTLWPNPEPPTTSLPIQARVEELRREREAADATESDLQAGTGSATRQKGDRRRQ